MEPSSQSAITIRYTGVFILLTLILWWSFPGNRSENDDGYFYAYAIRSYDYAQLWFPRYLIFLPFFKALLSIVQKVVPNVDAYLLMCGMSAMVTAAAVLVFYRILKQQFHLSVAVAQCSAAALLLSYGYWRYAVEAEVYAMALLLCLMTVNAAISWVRNESRWQSLLLASLLAALTVLWYKPAAAVVCIAVPLYLLMMRVSIVKLIVWSTFTLLIVMATYLMAYQFSEQTVGYWYFLNSGIDTSAGHPLNAGPVVMSNVVSLNFIYAFPAVVKLVQQWFPGKQLVEEIFAAKNQSTIAVMAIVTLLLLMSFSVFLLWKVRRHLQFAGFWKNPFALWLVIYSAALLVVDPGSPEPWLMIQPALFALIGIYIFSSIEKYASKQILYVLVLLLCLHNFVGGYLFIRSAKQDYTRHQAAWLIHQSSEKDMVISLGSASAIRYLLYYGKAKVFTGEQQFTQAMLAAKQVQQEGGKIFLTDDFVHPTATVQRRNATAFALVQTMLQEQRANIHLQHPQDDTSAAVYEWKPK